MTMAPTLTLQDARKTLVDEQKKAAEDNETKQRDLTTKRSTAEDAVRAIDGKLTEAKAEMSRLHQELASATMQQDQHAAELKLAANKKTQYELTIAKAATESSLAELTDQLAAATALAAAARAGMSRAQAELSAGTADAILVDTDRAALSTVVADAVQQAKAAIAAPPAPGPADQKLEALTGGAKLVVLLKARFDHAQAVVNARRAAAGRLRDESATVTRRLAGETALVSAAGRYDLARSAAHSAVVRAQDWLKATKPPAGPPAPGVVGGVDAGPSEAVLKGVAAAAKAAEDAGAVDAETTWQIKGAALVKAEEALAAQVEPKVVQDPSYDPNTDDSLKALRDAVTTASEELKEAVEARQQPIAQGATTTLADLILDWDLSLPAEATKQAIVAFMARQRLVELAAIDPTALSDELDAAETAYATELQRQARDTVRAAILSVRLAEETAFEGSVSELIASFVRGTSAVPQ
jgi:hypothetical protein